MMLTTSYAEPALIMPSHQVRELVELPRWFKERACSTGCLPRFRILLADSAGKNLEDLMTAWCLNMADRSGMSVIVADDQRDPELCQSMIAQLIMAGFQPDAVIGHFSSPVAIAAASVYRRHQVPFFAPGSSADDLASDPTAPVFQFFGLDSGQVAAISQQIAEHPVTIALAERGNAGETLLRKISDTLPGKIHSYNSLHVIPKGLTCGCPLLILGSREFAVRNLEKLSIIVPPSEIILSDDSADALSVLQASANQYLPIRVAILHQPKDRLSLIGFDTESVLRDAERHLGRCPGPFYLTAWATIFLAARFLNAGLKTPHEMLAYMRQRTWSSPYGQITFSETGRQEGMTWELRRIQ